jgi:serine/threonine protein kinase
MLSAQIDDYEVGEVIGVGTVGTIYAAVHRQTGERVAIKKLHPGVCQDPLIRSRFRREALILARLNHPHIVRSFGGGNDRGQLFYVMELIDGGTVKHLLQTKGAFAWPIVVEIGRQVCSALQFLHNHGVIHRDLKPSNLFLTRDATVKLGDFGIARDLRGSDITTSGMTVGTHAYMAPEQITGDSNVSGKADLYSLGCCLFEMLVGRTPFQGDNFAQLFEQHLRSAPPHIRDFVPGCPEELDAIVFKLLAKNPEERPFNARQVQAVMLQLGTSDRAATHAMAEEFVHDAEDVSAHGVEARGRELLKDEIALQLSASSRPEISWAKLAAMSAAIAALIGLALLLGR